MPRFLGHGVLGRLKQLLTMEKDLIRPAEVAERLPVRPQTLRLWDRQGKLQPLRLPRGQRRYRKADLEALMGSSPYSVSPRKLPASMPGSAPKSRQLRATWSVNGNDLWNTPLIRGIRWSWKPTALGLNPRRRGLRKDPGCRTEATSTAPDRMPGSAGPVRLRIPGGFVPRSGGERACHFHLIARGFPFRTGQGFARYCHCFFGPDLWSAGRTENSETVAKAIAAAKEDGEIG